MNSTAFWLSAKSGAGLLPFKVGGGSFTSKPHLIAPMEDHDLWMAFFEDLPDGHTLALMHEAPKGYSPVP
jgi:hypothetical protein